MGSGGVDGLDLGDGLLELVGVRDGRELGEGEGVEIADLVWGVGWVEEVGEELGGEGNEWDPLRRLCRHLPRRDGGGGRGGAGWGVGWDPLRRLRRHLPRKPGGGERLGAASRGGGVEVGEVVFCESHGVCLPLVGDLGGEEKAASVYGAAGRVCAHGWGC